MTATLSGTASLIGAVPHLVGFTPSDSIVLIFLDGSRLVCTARLDLDSTDELILNTVATVTRQAGTVEIVAITYAGRNPCRTLPMPVTVSLLVNGDRYFRLDCDENTCGCPMGGTPIDTASTFVVEQIVDGSAPRPTRDLEPGDTTIDAVTVAQGVASYSDRDDVWMALDALTDPAALRRVRDGWIDCARHAGAHAAPAWFLAGWASFRLGDGGTANVAVGHCLNLDPAYSAATMLSTALAQGVNGTKMPRLSL